MEFERPCSKKKALRAEEQTEEEIILAGGIFTTAARGVGTGDHATAHTYTPGAPLATMQTQPD